MSERENESAWTHLASRRERERDGAGVVATLRHKLSAMDGVLVDISRLGARFETTDLRVDVVQGAWVTLRFTCYRHATREEIEAVAHVVWRKDYHDGARQVHAFGLSFGDPIDLRRVEFSL